MNADRRKRLAKAVELLEEVQAFAVDKIAEAKDLIDEIAGEEREAYDNLPEGLQVAERGERMSEIADALENITGLDDIENTLQEAIDAAQEAQE